LTFANDQIGQATIAGQHKQNQDDMAFLIARDESACLLVVADGVSRSEQAELASGIAVNTLRSVFASEGFEQPEQRLRIGFQQAHERIKSTAGAETENGACTTLTAAVLDRQRIAVAHVGDTRALQFHAISGRLYVRRLTEDQLYGIRHNRQSEAEAQRDPKGRALWQAIGRADIEISVNTFDVSPGDWVVLCSDGVSNYVNEQRMARLLSRLPPDVAARSMVEEAREAARSAQARIDDCTAVIARIPTEMP
jgi:serine/threonine protein phosphatase PrpC